MRHFSRATLIYTQFTILAGFMATSAMAQTDFWQQSGLTNVSVVALAINSNGDIFAGTEVPGSSAGGDVFRSSDNGDNWTSTGLDRTVATLAINASGDIFAGGNGSNEIFRSTDNGASWTRINNGLGRKAVPILAINASGDLFGGTSSDGVFRSIDNGDNWTQTGLTSTGGSGISALAVNAGGDIFAGANGVVFRSSDNGDNWTQIDMGLTGFNPVQAFAFNASGDIFSGIFNSGVLRSTDNGDTWRQTGLTNASVMALAFNSSGDLFAGTIFSDGVFLSTDNGDNWSALNGGLTNIFVNALAINNNDRIFAGTGGGGVFRSKSAPPPMPRFTVANTSGSGAGSLRQAILDANADAGLDTIRFNISGAGPHTIQPLSALPTITDPVIIDGYTQPGATANTNGPGSGSNAVLKIELDGSNTEDVRVLYITAGSSTVRGLAINRFAGQFASAIAITRNGGNVIEGNFIGTDVTGTAILGNGGEGIYVLAPSNTIGGTAPSARNLISGNKTDVRLQGSNSSGNVVQGNFIGADVTGTVGGGNPSETGILIHIGASNNTIGGTTAGARNVISGNNQGVAIVAQGELTRGNLVQGNFIGTDVTGTMNLGNSSYGLLVLGGSDNTIGGSSEEARNIIAFNGDDGVFVQSGSGNAIELNSIFSNADLGIDLGANGVTSNDPGDGDAGPNNLQNFPVLASVTSGSAVIAGALNSVPNTDFRLEFFSNNVCDPSGHGEGKTFLGADTVTTDNTGNIGFTISLPDSVAPGTFVTATATDPGGNTSEFAMCVEATPGELEPPQNLTASVSANSVVLNWAPPGGAVANETEPNNTPQEADAIGFGQTAKGAIDPAGDGDFWRFRGTAGQDITIDVDASVNGSSLDAVLSLFIDEDLDGDGSPDLIAGNDDFDGLDSRIAVTLPKTNAYFILIADFSMLQGGPGSFYEMSLISSSTPSALAKMTPPPSSRKVWTVSMPDLLEEIRARFGNRNKDHSATSLANQAMARGRAQDLRSYNIYRSTSSPVGITNDNLVGNVNASITSLTDADLPPDAYHYVVTAVYDPGESDPSNEVSAQVHEQGFTFWQATHLDEDVFSLAANSAGHIFAGADDAIFRSTDNGDTWRKRPFPNYFATVLSIAINGAGHIFAGSVSVVFRSTNNGDNWTVLDPSLQSLSSVNALVINDAGHIFAGTNDGVFRSTDNGDNWTAINTGLPDFTSGFSGVNAVAINSLGHIFAGTDDDGMFRSTDDGDNWAAINTGLTDPVLDQVPQVNTLAINGAGHIFAGTGNDGVFRSTDNGDNWTAINAGLPTRFGSSESVSALTISGDGHIFAGTNGGVFYSTDNGNIWTANSTGLPDFTSGGVSVFALAINSRGDIFAGTSAAAFLTDGGDVFRHVESPTAVEEVFTSVPSSFGLEQNYPNPFNPSTTIQFALVKRTHVALKLFNIRGREVATLVDGPLGPGSHKVVLEANGLPSGVYVYRITAGGFVETKKLTLLK